MEIAKRTLSSLNQPVPIREVARLIFVALAVTLASCAPEPTPEPGLEEAERQMEAGNPAVAADLLEQLRQEFPDTPRILEALAFAYAEAGDRSLAAHFFTEFARTAPQRQGFLLFAAQLLQEEGRLDEAADRYEEYLDQKEDDATAWKSVGEVYELRGTPLEAIRAYTRSYNLREDPSLAVTIGTLFFERANFAQAQSWWDIGRESDEPQERRTALAGLARVAVVQRNFPAAEAFLDELGQHFPETLEEPGLRNLQRQLAEWRQRQDALAATLEEDPLLPENEAPAEEVAEPAVPDPEPTVAEAEPDAPDPAPSPLANETTEEPAPSPPEPVQPTEIVPSPEEPQDVIAQARTLVEAGRAEEAVQLLWAELNVNDAQPRVWEELSDTYLLAGNFSFAEVAALEAVRRAPSEARYTLQMLEAVRAAKTQAIFLQEAQRARQRFPNDPDIALLLARGYVRAENALEAAIMYREFLNLAPASHPERRAAQEELRNL